MYQTFVWTFGTNNFPDCSNMCHEASGIVRGDAIGIGSGTVQFEDLEKADAIFVVGQNPGTNHPRMLTDLSAATARSARVVIFNPLKERGLKRFSDPQKKGEMARGGSTPTSTDYSRPRLGGDMTAFRVMAKYLFAADDEVRRSGQAPPLDDAFFDAMEREWNTLSTKANVCAADLPEKTEWQRAKGEAEKLVLQTFCSHDQYDTTIYGMDDRYRRVFGQRYMVFVNAKDLKAIGAVTGDVADIVSTHDDGQSRVAKGFQLVAHDIPRGCVAGHCPELNALVLRECVERVCEDVGRHNALDKLIGSMAIQSVPVAMARLS